MATHYTPTSDRVLYPNSLLDEIDTYVLTDIVTPPFWKLLFTKNERVRRIEGYQNQLAALVAAFHVCSPSVLVNI